MAIRKYQNTEKYIVLSSADFMKGSKYDLVRTVGEHIEAGWLPLSGMQVVQRMSHNTGGDVEFYSRGRFIAATQMPDMVPLNTFNSIVIEQFADTIRATRGYVFEFEAPSIY